MEVWIVLRFYDSGCSSAANTFDQVIGVFTSQELADSCAAHADMERGTYLFEIDGPNKVNPHMQPAVLN